MPSHLIGAEPITPELALVDPELCARARAALGDPAPPRAYPSSSASGASSSPRAPKPHQAYPFWARTTAALWLVVLGILVGGAAIPHAQDTPRVIPANEDITICRPTDQQPPGPFGPNRPGT